MSSFVLSALVRRPALVWGRTPSIATLNLMRGLILPTGGASRPKSSAFLLWPRVRLGCRLRRRWRRGTAAISEPLGNPVAAARLRIALGNLLDPPCDIVVPRPGMSMLPVRRSRAPDFD